MNERAMVRGRWWQRVALALIAATFLAAACGSDQTTATTSAAPAAGGESSSGPTTEPTESDAMSDAAMVDGEVAQDEMSDAMDGHSHGEILEVPSGMAVPEVAIEITPDPMSGQNLHVSLSNLTIAPEHASTEPIDGEGHMHLYVDGERIARFYNPWMHLALTPGDHVVEVEVSANNHSAYAVDGQAIRASAEITVVEQIASGHEHSDETSGVVAWTPAPSVTLATTVDPKSGWNVHASVADFEFAPEHASTMAVDGEGHMHLYVNGTKITRLYGDWYHLPELPIGDNEIMVELNGNDHVPLTIDGTAIAAKVAITVTADSPGAVADGASDDAAIADGTMADQTMDEGAIVVERSGDAVSTETDRYEFDRGDTVLLIVESDVADEVHVHGYDRHLEVAPGEQARLEFVADIPGVFEVEFESSGLFIAELQVS